MCVLIQNFHNSPIWYSYIFCTILAIELKNIICILCFSSFISLKNTILVLCPFQILLMVLTALWIVLYWVKIRYILKLVWILIAACLSISLLSSASLFNIQIYAFPYLWFKKKSAKIRFKLKKPKVRISKLTSFCDKNCLWHLVSAL